jgi:hypothetical protein
MGHPGRGALIGGGIGALGGVALGDQMEGQYQRQEAQSREVEEQRRELDRQRQDIDELRRSRSYDDNYDSRNYDRRSRNYDGAYDSRNPY